ncbi:TIGR01777 family protein [Aquipseudomonas campi]|uniref:TIGR01777 family protein n=1 Tax=Aquipseudomonas campi TaxID=2731681 RepID=A0A6M8FCU1_9GAMM|nr:TIGR01777 family oxidoreductase [Pseudomonas campi]QKE62717.1 TIGR01777 family protein [Pseudomonas campi]
MQNLLYRWLLAVGLGHVLLGVVLAFTAQLPIAAPYFQYLYASVAASPAPTAEYHSLLTTMVRLFGPTVASWGLLFSLLVYLYRQHGHALIKPALFAALLLWCVLDSAISAYYGILAHTYLNTLAALSIALPLYFLAPRDTPSSQPYALRYASGKSLRILMTGGTGFIGRPLANALSLAGHDVLILTRSLSANSGGFSGRITFLTSLEQIPSHERIDCIINLAGEPLAKGRWTPARKERFLQSRLQVTDDLLQLVQRLQDKPEVLLNASAVGYYGHQQDARLDETAKPVDCFSHQFCRNWEEHARAFEAQGLRVCLLRIGVVLGQGGGPLQELRRSFDWGVATQLGNGQQWLPWIHLQDVLDICAFLLSRADLHGAVNVTAPAPVTQREFGRALAQQMRHVMLRAKIPAWLLRLLVGEMADEILLSGQRVIPQKLLAHGYSFTQPELPGALSDLIAASK